MRYLNPVSNPFAHYWEEDLSGIWGIWTGLRGKTGRAFNYLLGELILANLYLLWEILGHQLTVSLRLSTFSSLVRRIEPGLVAKRAIDIAGAATGLLLSAPLWLVISLMIKLDSRGPVIYSQVRVGQNRRRTHRRSLVLGCDERRKARDRRSKPAYGRPFRIRKFRTMREDAEKLCGPTWATRNDPRVTRVGRMLRKTRMDEIPQLINVLMGDMSLVGPRPERPFFVEKLDGAVEKYRGRFSVKPGVTGLAQVEHKYDECIEDVNGKIVYDLKYIKSWSVYEDIKILLKTVAVVLTARGM